METVILRISLTEDYEKQVERIRHKADLRKCRSWPELLNVTDAVAEVELTETGITVRVQTAKGMAEDSCGYDSVMGVTEMREGILLRISHKRLLFLPAAETGTDSKALMSAVYFLSRHCRYLFKEGSVGLRGVGVWEWLRFRTRKRQGYYAVMVFQRIGLPLLIVFALFIGTVFVAMPFQNYKISKSQAQSVSTYLVAADGNMRVHRRKHGSPQITMVCAEMVQYRITGYGATKALLEELEGFSTGTPVEMLLHPKSGEVLELIVDGRKLLDFDGRIDSLWTESMAFVVLGVLMYSSAATLIVLRLKRKL